MNTILHSHKRRGFSMVELLTVVAIISVMAVLIGVGLGGGNESVSLGNGQRIAASVFQSARSTAILKQTRTRVVIYADQGGTGTDPRKFLRYMGIVYDEDGNDATDDFVPSNQGTYLPEGVFFMPDGATSLSGVTDLTGGGGDSVEDSSVGGASDIMSVSFPVTEGTAESFYFYGFDKNGMSENPGGSFVLNAGTVISDTPIEIGIENQYAVAGFAIRRIGGVTLFNDYDEISALNN